MKQIFPRQDVAEVLRLVISQAHKIEVVPEITYADPQFGDFQTNVAMKLAKELGSSPHDIARPVVDELLKQDNIESADTAGPGFINITLADSYWLQYMENIDHDFGKNSRGRGARVQVEYISANPTGPLTLGNARGGFIGDVLSNVLATQGYEVTREYYFNDAGTQIGKLIDSLRVAAGVSSDGDRQYSGEYIASLADDFKEELKTDDNSSLGERITESVFEQHIKPALKKANITFDVYTNERKISQKLPMIINELGEQELIEQRDGATWLKSSQFGDERDRVLIKSNEDITYLGNDIAYHYDIFNDRKFDKAIKIWGADHAGQVPSLQKTLNHLFPGKKLDFIIVQWVRLIKNGKEFKISKRAGTYVTVEELVDRVGVDVARWFMLMRSNDTHMDFDLDLATEQSQKNPFWYVMYSYVRAQSICREADKSGIEATEGMMGLTSLERDMAKELSRLPDLLDEISQSYEVHKLTHYGQSLSKIFHEWYEKVRVLDLPSHEASTKLYFLQQYIRAMDVYWSVLGIEPYKKM